MNPGFLNIYCHLWFFQSWRYWAFVGLFLIGALLSACVSFKLSPQTQKSQRVSYQPPKAPFITTRSESADMAWIDSQTGNIISYQSICNESLDPDLNTILQKSTSGLTDKKFLKRNSMDYNARKATRVLMSGQLDGVTVHLDFVLLKKNACSYILSLVGLPEHFDKAKDVFHQFMEGFKIK